MPWSELSLMSQRQRFVKDSLEPLSNFTFLCSQYGISRKTGYKWLNRYNEAGVEGLLDRSRRPQRMPRLKINEAMESAIVDLRLSRRWGARKIQAYLKLQGWDTVPSPSTIHAVIQRYQLPKLCNRENRTYQRFEAAAANDLWQMDFKGPIELLDGTVEPLTVLDDCSRYSLGIRVCTDKRDAATREQLTLIFKEYGLPKRILADNGRPWGAYGVGGRHLTHFSIWLMTLGVGIIYSRPYHPQTCGKEERFHRTLKQELTGKKMDCHQSQCQAIFNRWRNRYNHDRPHEALGMTMPAQHYTASTRPFPERIKGPEYLTTDAVRIVHEKGRVCYRGHKYRIGEAYRGYEVAVRDTDVDYRKEVYFYNQRVAEIDLKTKRKVLPMSPNNV